VTHRVDVTVSTGATNRWLAIDLGRAPAYPDRKHADDSLLTFTSGPLPADVHVLGFPVVAMRLATSGTDGAVSRRRRPSPSDSAATPTWTSRFDTAKENWCGWSMTAFDSSTRPVRPAELLILRVLGR
jgi:hypothetical protein